MQIIGEDLQAIIFSYLNAIDLINLCYVSKYYIKLILSFLKKHYNISTGFCSVRFWTNKIEENLYGSIENIYNNLFDTIAFDVEWNYDNLFKEFHHPSLFSVCLHFLRCQRSCEKNCANYCRMCSRVRFLSLKVSDMDGYLNISNSDRVDFDVFLSQPAYFPYAFCELGRKCTQHQVFNYIHDLFAAFC